MTRAQAAKKFDQLSKELMRLNGSVSEHISRMDNNWVFEASYALSNISERIKVGYNLKAGYTYSKGGGVTHPRGATDGER